MRVIARKALRDFWHAHRDAEQPLKAWFREAQAARWDSPHAVKAQYHSASVIGSSRVSEVMSGKRGLSIRQIRNLHETLQIPYENLIGGTNG